MTAEELGAYLYDLLSEASHVVETVWVKETPEGQVLVVGMRNGALHHVTVTSAESASPS
ncbi:MAG: hypothetical protein KJS97_09520 [Alphaproteobacteria bacterium]|nr:hypothetical protein [Alphaproteobacteria bacterium]